VVDPKQIPLTLKFLGRPGIEGPVIAEAMKEAAKGIEPFTVRLRGTGAFPSKNRIRVIWVGMNDILPMGTMATRLDELLSQQGFERERRPFAPHLTVARSKVESPNRRSGRYGEQRESGFGTIFVDRIRLKKSVLTHAGAVFHGGGGSPS
jgi:2'-5' RNA ligase